MSAEPSNLEPISVSVKTAAQLLGIGVRQVWQMLESGRLSRCKFGRRTVIPYSDLKTVVSESSQRIE